MAVAAGVVDVALRAAGVALAQFAPERRGAAALDRAQRPVLDGAKTVRGAKRDAVRPDDVGQFRFAATRASLARGHGALLGLGLWSPQQLQG